MSPENKALQIGLLEYFSRGKPIMRAVHSPNLVGFSRQQIKAMKNSLLATGLIDTHRDSDGKPVGMKTNGRIYFITKLGKRHLKDLGA